VGLFSFLVNRSRWSWQRALPWFALLVLSALQARLVPFFAVLAGPIAAWNLQEAFAGVSLSRPIRFARAVAMAAGLALLVCAWPGWLQGRPFEPRRWALEFSPSLERGARAIQQAPLAGQPCLLHLSPVSANAFAWFAPGQKGVLDEQIARAIRNESAAPEDWRQRMRSSGATCVVLYDADRGRLYAAAEQLFGSPEEWPLLFLEGDLAIFGWHDPTGEQGAESLPNHPLDLDRAAFSLDSPKAAREGPDRKPEPRRWWQAFFKPFPPRTIDRDEATLRLFHAEALRRLPPLHHLAVWENSQAAGLVAAQRPGLGVGAIADFTIRRLLFQPLTNDSAPSPPTGFDRARLWLQKEFTRARDDAPPAVIYLAVRAARRAVAANPDDGQAWVLLGETYLELLRATRERLWGLQLPELKQLRQEQASTALNQGLALQPNHAKAHHSLGELYREMGCLDLAVHHLNIYQTLVTRAGGRLDEEFSSKLSQLAADVAKRQKEYESQSRGKDVLDRALAAEQKKLTGKARDILLESHVSAFGARGMDLELELLLRTGRARDVLDWTSDHQKEALGPRYHMLRARAAAAWGNYALAEEEYTQLMRTQTTAPDGRPIRHRDTMALMIAQMVLNNQPKAVPWLRIWTFSHRDFLTQITTLAQGLKKIADAQVLQGLLALELGEVGDAEAFFREALSLWKNESSAASGASMTFHGRVVAQDCLKWLEEAGQTSVSAARSAPRRQRRVGEKRAGPPPAEARRARRRSVIIGT
jgi:hypothetical protein